MYILYAKDIDRANELGGKASALARVGQDAVIPDWFVLSPAAFEDSLSEAQQLAAVNVNGLADIKLNDTAIAQLADALAQLCPNGEPVAVRSSALDEDGAQHSFAGQLESFLNVPIAGVSQKVIAVWRSGFADRLLAYCQEHRLPVRPPAVLIQKMVKPEVAGVAFSADPVTGQRGVAVVAAVSGLAEALVSGEQAGTTWRVNRQGQVLAASGLPEAVDLGEQVLTQAQVQAIAGLACQMEQQFERPQDIEWAIERGTLYLLQSRPITTLKSLADPDAIIQIWDNSNISESYGGTTTPLTFSFAQQAYAAVYRQFCRLMGVSEAAIDHHATTFRCLLGLIQGRLYYNLLNWYRVLALLPGFTINRRFMEQMMGVREELPSDVLSTLENSLTAKLQDGLRLVNTIAGLLKNYITLPRQIRKFYQRLDRALMPVSLATLRPDELVAYYRDLEQQLLTHWDAPIVNDFFAMIFYGSLRKLAMRWCAGDTLQNDLISGEGGMISAEPAQRVRQMAAAIAPDFAQTLCYAPLREILQALPQYPTFQADYQAYLEKFGDRCLEELKLESETLQDNPLPLLRSIGQVAQQPFRPLGQQTSLRSAAEAKVRELLRAYPLKRAIFNWVLHNARARVRDRENLRFERTRVFGRVRRILLELGKRFFALDLLDSPKDIFYLELNEVLGFVEGTATCTDLKGLVAVRQAEFARYRTLSAPPDRFSTAGTVHPFLPLQESPILESALQGIGCCPGVVAAPVQVITDPHTAQLQSGHILVAERTDPGWILLFPAAAGLLVERGSVLSHAAIVAREMGIPAIVSIPGITRSLQTGDWIEMDGSTGAIRLLNQPLDSEAPCLVN